MKDIIATLEAKRAAFRTGGSEKRNAAQHAKGKLARRERVFFAAFAAFALLSAPADAQRWTDPEGHFTLDYGLNWQPLPPETQTNNPQVLAVFTSVSPLARRLCNVRRQAFPAPAELDQAAANRWLQVFTTPPAEASNRRLDEVEGIVFINFDLGNGEFAGHYRAFALPDGATIARTEFMCVTRSPTTPEDEAAMAGFLSGIELTSSGRTSSESP